MLERIILRVLLWVLQQQITPEKVDSVKAQAEDEIFHKVIDGSVVDTLTIDNDFTSWFIARLG